MGDSRPAGKPVIYVTNYLGQLSLAIPSWINAISTGDGYGRRWEENGESCSLSLSATDRTTDDRKTTDR